MSRRVSVPGSLLASLLLLFAPFASAQSGVKKKVTRQAGVRATAGGCGYI
jgi:hypothetical protein